MAEQERTCVICRSSGKKGGLARIVARGNAPVWDVEQSLPGRGGYVHVEVSCLAKMAQVGRWERALRMASGTLDVAELRRLVTELMAEATRGAGPAPKGSAPARPVGRVVRPMLRGIK